MTSLTYAGLDVGFSNDFMAQVTVVKGNDEKIRIVNLDTWRNFDWHLWKRAMKEKHAKFNIDWICVDRTNNQTVVMELQGMGMSVEGVSFTNPRKYDMIQNMTKQIVTGELVMPVLSEIQSVKQRNLATELSEQLREQEYRHESANVKLGHPQGRHDDLLWALCLALYGVSMKWSCCVPIVECVDYEDTYPPEYQIPMPDRVMERFRGNGITVTDVKITYPGDQ